MELKSKSFSELQQTWKEEGARLSGTLTSNAPLPKKISKKILSDKNFNDKYLTELTE